MIDAYIRYQTARHATVRIAGGGFALISKILDRWHLCHIDPTCQFTRDELEKRLHTAFPELNWYSELDQDSLSRFMLFSRFSEGLSCNRYDF